MNLFKLVSLEKSVRPKSQSSEIEFQYSPDHGSVASFVQRGLIEQSSGKFTYKTQFSTQSRVNPSCRSKVIHTYPMDASKQLTFAFPLAAFKGLAGNPYQSLKLQLIASLKHVRVVDSNARSCHVANIEIDTVTKTVSVVYSLNQSHSIEIPQVTRTNQPPLDDVVYSADFSHVLTWCNNAVASLSGNGFWVMGDYKQARYVVQGNTAQVVKRDIIINGLSDVEKADLLTKLQSVVTLNPFNKSAYRKDNQFIHLTSMDDGTILLRVLLYPGEVVLFKVEALEFLKTTCEKAMAGKKDMSMSAAAVTNMAPAPKETGKSVFKQDLTKKSFTYDERSGRSLEQEIGLTLLTHMRAENKYSQSDDPRRQGKYYNLSEGFILVIKVPKERLGDVKKIVENLQFESQSTSGSKSFWRIDEDTGEIVFTLIKDDEVCIKGDVSNLGDPRSKKESDKVSDQSDKPATTLMQGVPSSAVESATRVTRFYDKSYTFQQKGSNKACEMGQFIFGALTEYSESIEVKVQGEKATKMAYYMRDSLCVTLQVPAEDESLFKTRFEQLQLTLPEPDQTVDRIKDGYFTRTVKLPRLSRLFRDGY